jgi:amino acid adenylation domain-containing protein
MKARSELTALGSFELLAHLRELDVRLWADGERLRFDAPRGAFTPELHAELTRRKGALLELLRAAGGEAGAPIERAARGGELLLSFSQERLWFLVEFEPGTPAYNLPEAVRLSGRLDAAALEASLREMVRRHEALRTTFTALAGRPVQVISPRADLSLPLVDLRRLAADRRETAAARLASRLAAMPFDLTRGPLIRAHLLRLAEEDHVFLLNIHHIVFDRWSMGVFLTELPAVYGAFLHRRPSPLPEPRLQYADFASWQRRWLRGEVLESLLAYWRRLLGGAPPVLRLPTDRPRPAVRTDHGAKHAAGLPAALVEALRKVSSDHGVTLFMTLLAAANVLLGRYTGQRDLTIGTFIANRNRPEVERLIGFFVNSLCLRTAITGDPELAAFLRQVRDVTLGAYAHQDLPFERLLEEVRPERAMSHSPLFQVMLVLQNTPAPALALPGLAVRRWAIEGGVWANVDWTMWLWEGEGGGLDGYLDFNTDLFDATTMRRLLGHWRTLLEGLAARPGVHLSELPILSRADRHQALAAWNDTRVRRPAGLFHQLFEAVAAGSPEAVAVVFDERRLTYGELDSRAGRLACRLRGLGIGPDVVAAVFAERSAEMIVAALAVLEAGGAYLPLDVTHSRERLRHLLAAARARVLLTTERLAAELSGLDVETVLLDPGAEPGGAVDPGPAAAAAPASLAYVVYTSGSTGLPKGVMVTHEGLVNAYLAWEESYRLRQEREPGRHLQMASFSFDVFAGDLARALGSGGRLVVCRRETLLEPRELLELMQRQRIDTAEFVPAVARGLMQELRGRGGALGFMRLLVVGSDAWHVREYRQLRHLAGPRTRCISSYGLSEVTIDSSFYKGTAAALPAEAQVPIGRPFAGTRTYPLTAELALVPGGVAGELCLGGLGLARGYLGQPALTAEKLVPDPFGEAPGGRLYRTGDLARHLADGNLELLGRRDSQVKIRGFRIEPAGIEAVLSEHPAVKEAVVVARDDLPGGTRLVAYLVARPDSAVTAAELRRHLKERLPDYMVPAAFTTLEALPLSSSGKVDRRRLPAPERGLEEEVEAASTPIEETLAEIFGELTGLARVGVRDSFFELGGHSLLATQAVSRIRETFEVELPLRDFFETPTIGELALAIEDRLIARVEALTEEEVEALT